MVSAIISRLVILLFGTLYPAYASYKAVKTKNVKEYVKWMMYWIVFALFTCVETLGDIFVSWLPFYYELKIIFVLWLLSPATKGSSILYRKFVHPQLNKREKEIDAYIMRVSDKGYSALISLGSKGFNYATNIVLTTAMKGQHTLADHLKKSYSLNDLTPGTDESDSNRSAFVRQDTISPDDTDKIDHEEFLEGDEGKLLKQRNRQREEATVTPIVEYPDDNESSASTRSTNRQKDHHYAATLPRTKKNRPAATEKY